MPATDSDRLLAAGVPLTLVDGRQVSLRYGFRALKAIEDEFGSLEQAQAATDGKVIGPLFEIIAAGLSHEKDITADDLLDLLDPRQINAYEQAVSAALEQAFPESTGNGAGGAATAGSPGRSATTSRRSGSAAATKRSGR